MGKQNQEAYEEVHVAILNRRANVGEVLYLLYKSSLNGQKMPNSGIWQGKPLTVRQIRISPGEALFKIWALWR